MIEGPKLIERPAQPYVGIRTQVTMSEFGSGIIPKLHDEVMGWLKQKGLNPSGAPMIIYHVIDMANKLDVEMAWPVAAAQTDDGRIHAGPLPAGRYASLLYTGDYSGMTRTAMRLPRATKAISPIPAKNQTPRNGKPRSPFVSRINSP
jgi:effector-binding domain-containing protein